LRATRAIVRDSAHIAVKQGHHKVATKPPQACPTLARPASLTFAEINHFLRVAPNFNFHKQTFNPSLGV